MGTDITPEQVIADLTAQLAEANQTIAAMVAAAPVPKPRVLHDCSAGVPTAGAEQCARRGQVNGLVSAKRAAKHDNGADGHQYVTAARYAERLARKAEQNAAHLAAI